MTAARTRKDRALTLVGNALPLIGAIVFGWDVAPAVFMLWLDTLFCNLQFGAMVLASATRVMPLPIEGPQLKAQRIGARLGIGIVIAAFCSPSVGAGIGMYSLLERHVTGDSLALLLASPSIYLWTLIEFGLGIYRVASAYAAGGYRDVEHMRTAAGARLTNICNRCAVLMALAWGAQLLGRFGLVAFLAMATWFIDYVEQHEDWLSHLQSKVEAAGRAYRARTRG